jgi:hypothetical protein
MLCSPFKAMDSSKIAYKKKNKGFSFLGGGMSMSSGSVTRVMPDYFGQLQQAAAKDFARQTGPIGSTSSWEWFCGGNPLHESEINDNFLVTLMQGRVYFGIGHETDGPLDAKQREEVLARPCFAFPSC